MEVIADIYRRSGNTALWHKAINIATQLTRAMKDMNKFSQVMKTAGQTDPEKRAVAAIITKHAVEQIELSRTLKPGMNFLQK